jgi:zinc protease
MQFSGKYGGHFLIVATVKPDKSIDEIKKIIFDEISEIDRHGTTSQELVRSKNVIKSNFIYSLQNIDTITDLLNLYNFYLDEPNSFNFDLERYNNCTEDKIREVTQRYFKKNYIDLRIVPEKNNAN